ncbi:unnamed protein product [Periconia digitata]|uniref:lytic cellulose monooxygenase (C4-dehydrogenating) n=1 Tax=Periconia digitata TaxID=1303443 RepID=A0A9W4XH82_9PLEO|nr:unnamed protein product [Periconia digitata]
MILKTIAALGALASFTSAHIVIPHLLVDKKDTGLWKHVLEVSAPDETWTGPYYYPGLIIPLEAYDSLDGENITCGRAAFNSLGKTEIADVVAGEEIGFKTWYEVDNGEPWTAETTYSFYHTGPAQVYLSRAPNDDLKSYHGDGDWFKVAYAGPKNSKSWELDGPHRNDFNFTLPRTTPPGAYLMRFEYIYVTAFNTTQFYVSCALVNVKSPGPSVEPGKPAGFARFPGTYKIEDPGITVPRSQDRINGGVEVNLLEYKPPGPPVWEG